MTPDANTLTTLEHTVARVTHLIAEMEASASQQDGFAELSMRQVLYLETIARLEHPSFSELAQALGVTRPSVTALVGRLMRNGYVQKEQDGEDRRSFHILLTHKGRQFSQMHAQMHRRVVQALVGRLDEAEIAQLASLLDKALGE